MNHAQNVMAALAASRNMINQLDGKCHLPPNRHRQPEEAAAAPKTETARPTKGDLHKEIIWHYCAYCRARLLGDGDGQSQIAAGAGTGGDHWRDCNRDSWQRNGACGIKYAAR